MSTPAEQWHTLNLAVDAYVRGDKDDMAVRSAFHRAVLNYAAARGGETRSAKPAPQRTGVTDDRKAGFVVRFGRSKGKTLAECDTDDLRWLAGAYQRSIDDPTKARFLDQNCADLDAVNAELETR